MGTRTTQTEQVVAIFDSVTGWAFGPVFATQEDADSFLAFAARDSGRDVRSLTDALSLTDAELESVHTQWLRFTGKIDE